MVIESVPPGKYILAVSGGVDSMVLLDLMKDQPGVELIIAHYDHGIRVDSVDDRQLVERVATSLGITFIFECGQLGAQASEATARQARYEFLERVRQDFRARAIITAHQQDDVLETAIINIIRGTGRKGLTSLADQPLIVRPMLKINKGDIISYAKMSGLLCREDSTNTDEKYLRNYVRHRLLVNFQAADRAKLLGIIENMRAINEELDSIFANLAITQPNLQQLDRLLFTNLPHVVAKDFLATWLRLRGINFDAKILERIVILAKVGQPGKLINISGGSSLRLNKYNLALVGQER
jgi:tRNA(Ile)-lysidine synthase